MARSLLGLGLGTTGAGAGGPHLTGKLYGVSSADLRACLSVAIGLLLVIVLACLLSAARAARVDPIARLRAEEPATAVPGQSGPG